MRMARNKKIALVGLSICMISLGVLSVFTYKAEKKEQMLEKVQNEALALLDERQGDYNDNIIVLNNTSHEKAESLAEKLNAKLRITNDGSFATLTLTEGRTVRDVYENDDYREELSLFDLDYPSGIAAIHSESLQENTNFRQPQKPTGGYSNQKELGSYLNYMYLGDTWKKTRGSGITVAVIDTGIDTDHSEFAGRISEYSYNATEDKIVKDWTVSGGGYDWSLIEDEQGHGTMVAGTLGAAMDKKGMVGVAPEVNVLVIKAECNADGQFTSTADLVFGLYYAIERDVDIINMSFGGESNPYAQAAKLAYDSDIICVAAAGNEATATPTYPAADENVIGVGALAEDSWELASYSNFGENVNVVAPGTVNTTSMGGGYTTTNGTSFSAPLVAGAAALFCSQNKYTDFESLTEVLYASSYDIGDLGKDYYYGFGALDVKAFILEERGTLTYDMMTDELDDEQTLFIRNHTLQETLEPERLYAVFDGWYYDPHYVEEFQYYEDKLVSDVTLYAKWVSADDEIPFTYRELSDGTIEITSYEGRRRFISVPKYIDGKLVTSIGANAFAGETALREVNLPSDISYIGKKAFKGCSNLTKIEIPEKVKTIGAEAFYENIRLTSVIFASNSNVTTIEDKAFAYCSALRKFEVPEKVTSLNGSAFFGATAMGAYNVHKNNKTFTSKGGVLFNATETTLIAYPANVTSSYTIPNRVKVIGNYAFGYTRASNVILSNVQTINTYAFAYSKLRSAVIPNSVTTMEKNAFIGSTYLSEVTLGNGLVKIGEGAFKDTALKSVTLPNKIQIIEKEAFFWTNVSSISFAQNSELRSIGESAFAGCPIQTLNLPKQLTSIGKGVFSSCGKLSAVTFANDSTLKTIGGYAFAGTNALTSVNLPNSVESIGDFAFAGSGLSGEIHIPEKVFYFGAGAFSSCENLQGFKVADKNVNYNSVDGVVYSENGDCLVAYPSGNENQEYYVLADTKQVGDSSFYGSIYLKNLYLNAELEEIDDYAFAYAQAIVSMEIPASTIAIGRYAFMHTPITAITFSDNAKLARLGYAAFAYTDIQTLRIPKNVSTIAQGVFTGCTKLQKVTFAAGSQLDSVSAYMFDGCENLTTVIFETGSALTNIQAHAFEGLAKLKTLDFGDAKVTNIDNFAFRFCQGLTTFYTPETVTNIGKYAFYYCHGLQSITIPACVERIGSYAFIGTNQLEVFFAGERLPSYLEEDWDHGIKGYYLGVTGVVTEGDWQYATLSSGDVAILKYTGEDKMIDLSNFPYGDVVTIGGKAFAFTQIESLLLPETLVTIQNQAFTNTKLSTVEIPASVEFIGREAFYNTSLETITFAEDAGIRTIERGAFERTDNLREVTLPASLVTLGRGAFKNSGIQNVYFEDGIALTEISQECFANSDLQTVTIPDSITKIGDSAFNGCAALETFCYGDQKLWLGANAFYDSGLTEFYVSENLYVVEEFALTSLNNLTEFTVSENNPYYQAVDGLLMLKDGKKLVSVPAGRTGSLTLPESIEKIGVGALEGTELSEVIFPDNENLLSIANRAFFGAENLTEITIPNSVVVIDYYAFAYAKKLEKVVFEEGSHLTGIHEGAFYGCGQLNDILIPDTVVEIFDFAFYACDKLTQIPIRETSALESIYSYSFAYTGISELYLPERIIDIGDYAFMGADLTSVIISPKNEKDLLIGIGAFESCNKLEYLEVPFIGQGFEEYDITWVGYMFGAGDYEANQTYIPESLKTVKINGSATFIGTNAFYGITSIEEVILPESVDTLYYGAFYKSTIKFEMKQALHLRKNQNYEISSASQTYYGTGISGDLVLSDSIRFINSEAFKECDNLTSIYVPDSVTSIGRDAFYGCSNLVSVRLPNGLKKIEEYLFSGCTQLSSLDIPDTVTTIEKHAFSYCTNLLSLELPYGLTTIENSVFYFSAVKSLKIPDSVTTLQSSAFSCANIESIEIPDSITTLESLLFYNCRELRFVKLPDSITSIGGSVFEYCMALTAIEIPQGVTSIGASAFEVCNSLTSIEIPENVTSIGADAFKDCNKLEKITINSAHFSLDEYASLAGSSQYGCLFANAKQVVDNVKGVTHTFKDGFTHIDTQDGFRFMTELDNKGNIVYKLIAYLGEEETITLPLTFNGNAYDIYRITGVKNVVIPEGMTRIGAYAFAGSGLQSIVIPEGVTSMGDYAFYDCELKNIELPKGITNIPYCAFLQCNSLVSITIPEGVKTIGTSAFSVCNNLTSIKLPNTLTSIGTNAFASCYDLTSIDIPSSVTNIGTTAFDSCSGLTSITLHNGLKTISQEAFKGCSSLTSIEIPDTVTSIGASAFTGTGIKEIIISDNHPAYAFENGLLLNNQKTQIVWVSEQVTDLVIPAGVTNISYMFKNCTNLESVRFEEGTQIKQITYQAFYNCTNLKSIELPEGINRIYEHAFMYCRSLTSIKLPAALKMIDRQAFMYCSGLTSIEIPEGVTTIGQNAFSNCTNLVSLKIPTSVTSIGAYAFSECKSLTSIEIPEGVTTIQAHTFDGCSNLKSIKLPNSLTGFAKDSLTSEELIVSDDHPFCTYEEGILFNKDKTRIFWISKKITDLVIPATVTSISCAMHMDIQSVTFEEGSCLETITERQFANCRQLTSIILPQGLTSIGAYAFQGCTGLTSVIIPNTVTSIGSYAFQSCKELTSIEIPASVTNMEANTFNGCSKLYQVTVNNESLSLDEYASLAGSSQYGYLFAYAKQVVDNAKGVTHTLKEGFAYVDTADGFRFMAELNSSGILVYKLVAYIGTESTVTLPSDFNGNAYEIYYMRGVTHVIIPAGVKVSSKAFYECSTLQSVEILEGVTSIGNQAFYRCSNLRSVTIPGTVASTDSHTFYGCLKLTSVTFGEGVKYIGNLAFRETGLTSVELPDSIISIGGEAFSGCNGLTSVTIPSVNSVSIGGYAFNSCVNLADIELPDNIKSIGGDAFTNTAYYNNPDNWTGDTLYIGKHFIKARETATNVVVQEGTHVIASGAFDGCYVLKYLEFGGDHKDLLKGLTNLETLVINKIPTHSFVSYFGTASNIPMTLKKAVLKEGVYMRDKFFASVSGITVFVENEERDVKWDDNFPNWQGGNTVVYGDKWISVSFYDHNNQLLSKEIFTTGQVIRVPYIKTEGDVQYSYVLEGFDIDGDGEADVIPATSVTDIVATAVVKRVVNEYTVNFYNDDNVYYSVTLPYGSIISLPEAPQKSGHAFVGWQGYTEGMTVGGDVNFYAKWKHHENGHVYGEAEVIAPTCESQGFDKYTCTICGDWYGENYVDALGHRFEQSEVIAPSCTQQGYTIFACHCGETYQDNYVEAVGHHFGNWSVAVAPTCTENGMQVRTCDDCGHAESADVEALGHNYSERVVKQATCEKEGEVIYTCACGFSITEVTQKTPHNYQKKYADKSFLKWLIELFLNIFYGYEGEQAYYFKCMHCGHIAAEEEVELSYGASVKEVCVHSLGDWTLLSGSICDENIVYGKVCSLCGHVVEAKLLNGGHSYSNGIITAPTCTEEGYTTYTCLDCGNSYVGDYTEASGHTYNGIITVPTCTEEGYTTYTCLECGDSYISDYVEANGHSYNGIVTEPTCTEEGYTTYTCLDCGNSYISDYVEANGHAYNGTVTAPTCTEEGYTTYTCLACGDSYISDYVEANGHSYNGIVTAPTCAEEGYTTYTCLACGDSYISDYTEANGHAYNGIVTAPTCTEEGYTTYICLACGDSYISDYTEANGHSYNGIVTEPTCTEEGYTTYTCLECGDSYIGDYTEASGHVYGDWVTIKEPSATEVGERRKTCECGEYISEEIPMLFDEDSSGDWMDSNDNSSNVKDSIISVNFGCSGALGSNMAAVLLGGSVACLFIKKRKND